MRSVRRFLRWGQVGFLRRRLPYVWCEVKSPFRVALFYLRRPEFFRLMRAVRRAVGAGQTVIEA